MAKVCFRYGTMNSEKSIDLLKVAHNYESQGKKVIVLSPTADTRSPKDVVESRIGLSHKAIPFDDSEEAFLAILDVLQSEDIFCILVDEAQFLTPGQVGYLCGIADGMDVPVIAYGLRTDFRGKLFPGSQQLLEFADEIEEIPTVCSAEGCGEKAIMNARFEKIGRYASRIVLDGEQIMIGGNDMYMPLCRKHYLMKKLEREEEEKENEKC